ncbi:unnamed protein product, partial [Musa acuminata subsp. burmannicoides]
GNESKLFYHIKSRNLVLPDFVLPFDAYKIKPWIILIKLILSNIYYENDISQNQNEKNITKTQNKKY